MLRIATVGLAVIGLVNGQSLKFESSSFLPVQPSGTTLSRSSQRGDVYAANNVTLKILITEAYSIKDSQIAGGPKWMDDFYDMTATAERPYTGEQFHAMLQELLTDRFKLRFHREMQERPVYALMVDKDGPKLKPHEGRSAGEPSIDQAQDHFPQTTWHATFAPMDYFAWRLSMILDRPVVDQTALKGGYDFDLKFTQELPPDIRPDALLNGEAIDTSGPPIFEAIRRQLGLKLERQKGPVDVW